MYHGLQYVLLSKYLYTGGLMNKFIEMSLLMDFYGELLSIKQKNVMEYYYYDNFSLGEIAEKINISRQGVYDSIKRSEEMLIEFDNKLELIKKFNDTQELLINANEKLDHCLKLVGFNEDMKKAITEAIAIINKSLKQL